MSSRLNGPTQTHVERLAPYDRDVVDLSVEVCLLHRPECHTLCRRGPIIALEPVGAPVGEEDSGIWIGGIVEDPAHASQCPLKFVEMPTRKNVGTGRTASNRIHSAHPPLFESCARGVCDDDPRVADRVQAGGTNATTVSSIIGRSHAPSPGDCVFSSMEWFVIDGRREIARKHTLHAA